MLKFMTAKAKGKKGEIYLYGDIGDWLGGPSTASIAEELKVIGDASELDIFINSGGGSIVDGMGIYNILLRHKARKVAHIDYLAASIASVIPMACDEIRIAGNGRMMIHRAWGGAFGNPDEIAAGGETLRGMEEDIVKTYVARTKMPADKVREMMYAETWMDAEKCKEMGFCDVVEEMKTSNRVESTMLNRYRNLPDDMRKQARAGIDVMMARMNSRTQRIAGASPATA